MGTVWREILAPSWQMAIRYKLGLTRLLSALVRSHSHSPLPGIHKFSLTRIPGYPIPVNPHPSRLPQPPVTFLHPYFRRLKLRCKTFMQRDCLWMKWIMQQLGQGWVALFGWIYCE